ncbi:hypothetical protein GDO78_023149 [Eleutherodactylus coqui]|uniref:Uncharacterized protein n=1 Tax=Eleutherodactylus coqui TaxID=57060 RepID=A0A8J6B8F7_ELECQ|nr:hypothetical protein GDO78_023149 [Eleutherodactylus coqui]
MGSHLTVDLAGIHPNLKSLRRPEGNPDLRHSAKLLACIILSHSHFLKLRNEVVELLHPPEGIQKVPRKDPGTKACFASTHNLELSCLSKSNMQLAMLAL